MSKRYVKVNSGAGPIQFPGGYPANDGQVAVLDDTEPRLQEYFDYPATAASFEDAINKFLASDAVEDYGRLVQVSPDLYTHSVVKSLADIADGEVLQFTPGFNGYVFGFSATTMVAPTTATKASTLSWTIVGDGHADIQVGSSSVPATLDLTTAGVVDGEILAGTPILEADRLRNEFLPTDAIVIEAASTTAFDDGIVLITTLLADEA